MEWNGRKRAPKIKAHSRRVRVRTTLRVQGDGPDLEKEEDRKDDANRTADKNERGRREHLHTGAASRGELSCSRLATFLHILHVVTWNCVARPLSCCATTARNFGSALRLCYTAAFAHRNSAQCCAWREPVLPFLCARFAPLTVLSPGGRGGSAGAAASWTFTFSWILPAPRPTSARCSRRAAGTGQRRADDGSGSHRRSTPQRTPAKTALPHIPAGTRPQPQPVGATDTRDVSGIVAHAQEGGGV